MSKPIDKVQQFPVEASFFENRNEERTWINATVAKVYEKDGEWHRTNSFNGNDLLKLNALMPRIMEKMHELEHGQKQAHTPPQSVDMDKVKQDAQEYLNGQSQGQSQDQGQTP